MSNSSTLLESMKLKRSERKSVFVLFSKQFLFYRAQPWVMSADKPNGLNKLLDFLVGFRLYTETLVC